MGAGQCGEQRGRSLSHSASIPPTRKHTHTHTHTQDVLLYYGAKATGSGPPALGARSPRQSFDPSAPAFARERGSYQYEFAHP